MDPIRHGSSRPRFRTLEEGSLRALLEGTAATTGDGFFAALVENLARALGTHGAWVTEYSEDSRRLKAISFWMGGRWIEDFEYDVAGTPCEPVVVDRRLVHVPERIIELYPSDSMLEDEAAVSYLGVPLLDEGGRVLGHIAVLDRQPLPEDPVCLSIFQIFAARAAAELRRLRAESNLREREERIRALAGEAEYLREEIRTLTGPEGIVGRSEPLQRVLQEVDQVAATDATVLLLGETGTGKELIARAIHAGSRRRDRPLVAVNCGAIPADLVESELFGHEKGAFTGATQRREGRFTLAHGGTLFLDEIAELRPALQVKLLRVLQEGELEPVGSSRTAKVDVRVIAATNRDLQRAVESGEFRGDLYFRLNVFPIRLPPLRERGDDVVLLAESFARRIAARHGRRIGPLSEQDAGRLRSYDWPGNVRELHNVIERAVITSREGRLDLGRALPERAPSAGAPAGSAALPAAEQEQGRPPIRTESEMREQERANLRCALESCGWRVAGERGAARLLGMKPSTLASRMRALGIRKPAAP